MHLNAISYAFSSTGTFNFSSAGTSLHLNAISYAFSSAGTFNFFNLFLVLLGSLILVPLGPLILVLLGPFYTLMPLVMLLVPLQF